MAAIDPDNAIRILDNLFLFEPPSIADIYAIRKLVEPELAATAAADSLSEKAFTALQATIRLYEAEPASSEDEYRQRLAELDFHAELARNSSNRLLGFVAIFLLSLLRDMTVCREIYQLPIRNCARRACTTRCACCGRSGRATPTAARQIMLDHMIEAEKSMLKSAAMRERPKAG